MQKFAFILWMRSLCTLSVLLSLVTISRGRPMQAHKIISIAPLSQINVWGLNKVGRPQCNANRNSRADQAPGKQLSKPAYSLPHTSSFICCSETCQEPLPSVGISRMHLSLKCIWDDFPCSGRNFCYHHFNWFITLFKMFKSAFDKPFIHLALSRDV